MPTCIAGPVSSDDPPLVITIEDDDGDVNIVGTRKGESETLCFFSGVNGRLRLMSLCSSTAEALGVETDGRGFVKIANA